jgi:hypothetical protein
VATSSCGKAAGVWAKAPLALARRTALRSTLLQVILQVMVNPPDGKSELCYVDIESI